MAIEFVDRVSTRPNRVKITPEDGSAAFYATMERADEPTVYGTPLNAENLNAMQSKGYELIGQWGYGGSFETDFKKYDELIFLYDRTNDLSFNACPPIHVPTIVLSDEEMWFGVQYSSYIRLKIKLSQSKVSTYEATSTNGADDTNYTIYIYGR